MSSPDMKCLGATRRYLMRGFHITCNSARGGHSVRFEQVRHAWVVVCHTLAEFASISSSQKAVSMDICVPCAHEKCIAVVMFGGCALQM